MYLFRLLNLTCDRIVEAVKSRVHNRQARALPLFIPIPPAILAPLLTSPAEIKSLITVLPSNKAPGPDSLPNIVLKNLPPKALVVLTILFNSILKIQHFPTSWKSSIVVPILKPQRPPTDPANYRPISLLNTMAKLAEKLILLRLKSFATPLNLIPIQQFGFKGGHNTTLALSALVSDIISAFNRKQSTAMLLLDVEKAFDTVWHEGLLAKLATLNFPLHFITLLRSFLSDRSFTVRINTSLSPPTPIHAGVPQGAVLSPFLYNIYTSDIPTYPNSSLLLFADDTALYASPFHAQTATQKLRYHLDLIAGFFGRWKIRINANKTEFVVFTQKFTDINITRPLRIADLPPVEKTVVRYLGLRLDRRLSFKPHITFTINKIYATLTSLYPLLNRRSQLSVETKLLLYKVILRPAIVYACPVWARISNTQYFRLQTLQNKLLRLALNADRYSPTAHLHEQAGVLRIREYIEEVAQKFYTTQISRSPLTRTIADARAADNTPHTHRFIHESLPIFFEPR